MSTMSTMSTMSIDEVYARVAERADLSRGRALEVTQIVRGVVATSLAADVSRGQRGRWPRRKTEPHSTPADR
jgi:hypothetical protein